MSWVRTVLSCHVGGRDLTAEKVLNMSLRNCLISLQDQREGPAEALLKQDIAAR